ncbi:MAG: PAS domain S-box protein [Bacteroidota bacterium]|nr:PAS domain S-box protein [Bacteroidota bacterium]
MDNKYNISVLYIEDEKETLAAITKMISRRVEKVYSASNAIDGLKIFKKYLPDIVITDISMPGKNGLELLEEINKTKSDYKSILISAFTETEYFTKAIELGVSEFIVKPVKKETLFLALNKLSKIIELEKKVKQQQLDIINSEKNYKAIFNNNVDSIAILDLDTKKIIDVNQNTCEEYGYSYKEMLKADFNTLSQGEYPYTIEEARKHVQICLKEGQDIFEWHSKRKDGTLFWNEISIKLANINGINRILIIVRNIDKRKQAELKSAEAEKKYFNLFNTANDAIFIIHNNKFVDCNKKALELFACSRDDIIGASPMDFSPEKQYNGKSSKLEAIRKIKNALNNNDQHFKWLHKKFNGNLFHTDISLNKTVINNKVFVQAIVRDISKQRNAERKLQESQIFLRKITDVSPSGIFVRDEKGTYIFANKTFADMQNINIDDIISKTDFDLIKNTKLTIDEAKEYFKNDREIYDANTEKVLPERVFIMPNGEKKHFQTIKKPLTLKDNTKVIIGYIIDITENKKNIILLEEKQKELEELNATKDKFFSIIAHDLKNPFGTTMNFAQLLKLYYNKNSDEKNLRIINNIYKGAKNAYNLLENLLDWSRSQTNRIEVNFKTFNISELIKNIINLEEKRVEEKKIKLSTSIEENIEVYADIDMINTVIRNLVSNAIKFTNENGEISIKAKNVKNKLILSVSDNGVGIKPEVIKTLFKIDTSYSTAGTNKEMGTGLGLILCKEFVEKNGGEIWVESTENIGSTFYFDIPVKKE